MPQSEKKSTGYRANVIVHRQGKGGYGWQAYVNGRLVAMSPKSFRRRRAAWRSWDRFAADVIGGIGELDMIDAKDSPTRHRFVPRESMTRDRQAVAKMRTRAHLFMSPIPPRVP